MLPDVADVVFDVRVAQTREGAHVFQVAAASADGAALPSRRYIVERTEHDDYLDLFAALARDFGTRMPRNRARAEEAPDTTPFDPLLTTNVAPQVIYGYGDPAVLRVDGERGCPPVYYLVCTSNDALDAFPILRSRTLHEWTLAGFVFPRDRHPAWALGGTGVSDYWAPEMHRVNGRYFIYFAARESRRARWRSVWRMRRRPQDLSSRRARRCSHRR